MTRWSLNVWLKKSKKEFQKYKKTKDPDDLAEAGEKLWNAFNILIQGKTKKQIRSYGLLKKEIGKIYLQTRSDLLLRTFNGDYELHKFFYQGWTEDIKEEENLFEEVLQSINILKKTLR